VNIIATWITTLCLDAPIVALVWQEFYAKTATTSIAWHHRILIFVAVWLGYAADRWLDSRRHRLNKTHRHLFFSKHRSLILVTWLCILAASLFYAAKTLTPAEFIDGCSIAIASGSLTFLIQTLRGPSKPVLKSFSTSLLILVSAALFTILPQDQIDSDTALAALSTYLLYLANCLAVQRWDYKIDRIQESDTFTFRYRLGFNLYLLSIGQLALGALLFSKQSPFVAMPLASLISLAILYPLDAAGQKLPTETRRLAADAALLSPLVLIAFS